MNITLEMIIGILLDIAMLLFILNIVHKINSRNTTERFTALTMGVGFLIYCISRAIAGESYALLIPGALGFMLSYTAFLFTFSQE